MLFNKKVSAKQFLSDIVLLVSYFEINNDVNSPTASYLINFPFIYKNWKKPFSGLCLRLTGLNGIEQKNDLI